ncbi:MAG: TolC family protein, partial [Treponemataceae bacterium]|nr:TolC family protein [Treponemataceae bacterium]
TNPMIDAIVLNVDEMLKAIDWPDGVSTPSSGQYITLYDGMENTYYNFQLEITQPIYTWGKITNAIKLYEEVAFIKQLQIASKRKQMATEVDTRLISLHYLAQIQKLLTQQNEYTKRLIKIAEDAEKSGLLLHQDVLDAKIKAQELDIAVKSVQEQYSNVLLGIQKLTGNNSIKPEDLVFEPDEETITNYAKKDRLFLESLALARDQDTFVILESLKKIQGYATKIANASVYWKPDFAFQASLGYAGSRFPLAETDWYRKDDYTANFTVAFKTTVWDGGKKLNEIKRAKSQEAVAGINFDDTAQTIKQKITEQFNTMDLAIAKIEYQRLKIETLDSKIKQQETIFKSGVGTEQDLIQAKIDRTSAEIEMIQQKLTLAAAVNTAMFLTGDK